MVDTANIPVPTVRRKHAIRDVFVDFLLLSISALLFSLSFPSFLSVDGWSWLAFVALAPMFFVVSRASWKTVALYGAYFGLFSYSIFNFWLAPFHPLAIIIVPTIYFTYLLVTFVFLRFTVWLFPKRGYLIQPLVWLAYEYLRTKGFLGYSYGIMGYSQYQFTSLIQLAAYTGVWGVSLLVVFPSSYIAAAFARGFSAWKGFVKDNLVPLAAYVIALAAAVAAGPFLTVDTRSLPTWRVALIQHNVDPWRGGFETYKINLERLKRISDEALKENPSIVIWSETAFVPGIDWHSRYREDPDMYDLVAELKTYLRKQKVPFVVGNDDGRLEKDRDGILRRLDYNASILFEADRIVKIYRKMNLVPFTENFPFEKQLPAIYSWLKAADTHFWERGREPVVFESGGIKFSTPICFEDSFGYLSRDFVRNGADVIVNMTNDSWSGSVAAAMQHLGMSIFRAVENRRSVVRATNGGMTCIIDPNGRIVKEYPPFKEGYLVGDVSIHRGSQSLYTRWGDWFAKSCLIGALSFLTAGTVFRIRVRKRNAIDNNQ